MNESNIVCLCHDCHAWITTHPKDATAEGWMQSRWTA